MIGATQVFAMIGVTAAAALTMAVGPLALTTDGLGPVRIGMSVAAVEAATKRKLAIEYPNSLECVEGVRADGQADHIGYLFENGRLARISVTRGATSTDNVTVKGLGIGASESDVRAVFKDIISEPHQYDDQGRYLTTRPIAGRAYRFEMHLGRIGEIHAGQFSSVQYVEGCL